LGQPSGLRTDPFLHVCHSSRWARVTAPSFPYWLSSAPLGAFGFFGDFGVYAAVVGGAPAVWATFGALVAPSGRAKWLRLTQVLAVLQYASGLALVAATTGLGELDRLERAVRLAPEFIGTWATVYLIGQAVLWWRISKRSQLQPTV
jgi:hypothetical protein